MPLPRAPALLSPPFAAALGHAVASFGFLEEALKRGVYALSLDDLGSSPSESQIDDWVTRISEVSDDSLGTLIDSFLAALDREAAQGDARHRLSASLRGVREARNMLCHASWRPAGDDAWRPGFVSSRGIPTPDRMTVADIEAIREAALAAADQVVRLARRTGHDDWTPDGHGTAAAAERARAAARTARERAERRDPPARAPSGRAATSTRPRELVAAAEPLPCHRDQQGLRVANGLSWHPLDDEDAHGRHKQRPGTRDDGARKMGRD